MKCPDIKSGGIFRGNSADLLECLPDNSVNLVVTSPPYADKREESYATVPSEKYVDWFMPIAREIKRSLKDDGSFVLNIKEHVKNGQRSTHVLDLVKRMQEDGWQWNETYIWAKENSYPTKPVKRLKDQFEYVYHFTKTNTFKFRPERVMVEGSPDTCARYQRGINEAIKYKWANFIERDKNDNYRRDVKKLASKCVDGKTMVYPGNVLKFNVGSNRSVNGIHHPAMFPKKLPSFFIDLMTDPGDTVLDPFAGFGTTNIVAKERCRETIGFDLKEEYVDIANERLAGTVTNPEACNATKARSG